MILAWSGSIDRVPLGWHLCDGSNGTPDLRDRFIVGAGSSYSIGATGGEDYHTLTISEMPSHNHGYYFQVPENPWDGAYTLENNNGSGAHRFTYYAYTDYAGGNQPHENRPPYYALAFIQRI